MANQIISKIKTKDGRLFDIRDAHTYTKDELNQYINRVISNSMRFVWKQSLDEIEFPDPHTIYLIPEEKKGDDEYEHCKEFVWAGEDHGWECLGYVDLSEYIKRLEVESNYTKTEDLLSYFDTHKDDFLNKLYSLDAVEQLDIDNSTILLKQDNEYKTTTPHNFINNLTSDKFYHRDEKESDLAKAVNSKALLGFIKYIDIPISSTKTVSADAGKLLYPFSKTITITKTENREMKLEMDNRITMDEVNEIISVMPIVVIDPSKYSLNSYINYKKTKDDKLIPDLFRCDVYSAGSYSHIGPFGTVRVFYI